MINRDCNCACDGLCKLTTEELLAVLKVRLKELSVEQLRTLNAFVMHWRSATNAQS
ncbi:MAG: hypothetical protein K2W95_15825 [Candidatus Obscuribacterales bacterium]|nr:hypothetical protein [Candidatus Obscuribacterales bacterium]